MPRRPLAFLPPISCDDKCHKARGSAGGTDYAVPVGTRVFAPFTGMAKVVEGHGTGGWYVQITNTQGHVCHLDHLSAFEIKSGRVDEGDLVARSGGALGSPGAGSATGPHLHADVDVPGHGRMGMEEYLEKYGSDVAGGGEPITEGEDEMFWVREGDGYWWLKETDKAWRKFTQSGADRITIAIGRRAGKVTTAQLAGLKKDFPDPSPESEPGNPVKYTFTGTATPA